MQRYIIQVEGTQKAGRIRAEVKRVEEMQDDGCAESAPLGRRARTETAQGGSWPGSAVLKRPGMGAGLRLICGLGSRNGGSLIQAFSEPVKNKARMEKLNPW